MELFPINRYETEVKPVDSSKEDRILQKLQKKIERKKKKIQLEQELYTSEKNSSITDAQLTDEVDPIPNEDDPHVAEPMDLVDQPVEPELPPDKSAENNFMVLGVEEFQKRHRVDMILPPWLAYPTVISKNLSEKGEHVEKLAYLSSNIKASLKAMNIEHLFPVQEIVIPWLLNVHQKPTPFRPRDCCVSAPTGSGKTLSYAIPIVQMLSDRIDRRIRALIVLPVNELAVQVLKVFLKLCVGTNLSVCLLSKLVQFEIEQSHLVEEFKGVYHSKVDICITTTGRLIEHIHSTKGFSLKSLQFLVLDEADRIMDQFSNNWLYHLDAHVKEQSDSLLSGRLIPLSYHELQQNCGKQPHKLLFSATLSQDPEKLQNIRLFHPKLFTTIVNKFEMNMERITQNGSKGEQRGEFIGKYTTPAELTEKYCLTDLKIKPLTLYCLIKENNWSRFLCFTNSTESAHRLSFVLQDLFGSEMKIEELSSGLKANVRSDVLSKFQTGKINGIICSDALARGIDVPEVDIIISYDAPRHIKTYIHRVGRTARAGRPGLAITILTKSELHQFNSIIKEGGKNELLAIKLHTNKEELYANQYAKSLENMQLALEREEQIKMFKQKSTINIGKQSVISQLQQQVQQQSYLPNPTSSMDQNTNLPESWKWDNITLLLSRRERKGKSKKQKKSAYLSTSQEM